MTTADDSSASVWELISRESEDHGDKPALTGWLQRMCRAAARDLPAMGVGVSLLTGVGDVMTVAASSETSLLIEELQFTMGEGPCMDAYARRRPVLVPDLSAAAALVWPGYAPAAHEHGVRAVFAFPLQVGAARMGALDLYRDHEGGLSTQTLARALTFAQVAMQRLLDAGQDADVAAGVIEGVDDTRFEVYQAQGMLIVQLGVSANEALARLRAHAYAGGRPINEVARDVLARKLVLESDT